MSGPATEQAKAATPRLPDLRSSPSEAALGLYVHVPLSFGLLAARIAHVLAVFIYW